MPGTKATAEIEMLRSELMMLLEISSFDFVFYFRDRERQKAEQAKWNEKIDKVKDKIKELETNDPYLRGMTWIPSASS